MFVLNVPGKPDGTIDTKEIAVLEKITSWMNVNSEATYKTRPWKIFGEGPNNVTAGAFHGDTVASFGAKDGDSYDPRIIVRSMPSSLAIRAKKPRFKLSDFRAQVPPAESRILKF